MDRTETTTTSGIGATTNDTTKSADTDAFITETTHKVHLAEIHIGSALYDIDMLRKDFHHTRRRKAIIKLKDARAELDRAIALLESETVR